ncbi:hypothetical protein Salat_2125600 [Sesamum alatum]|uniref:Uncharacterized protein n=1 Tax=Sesamum alatum TaxID=300844 RepID=A0AAE1Y108_9LAMI|nr:hypothetical protein Salat_2125600 [Sesamum alatum]
MSRGEQCLEEVADSNRQGAGEKGEGSVGSENGGAGVKVAEHGLRVEETDLGQTGGPHAEIGLGDKPQVVTGPAEKSQWAIGPKLTGKSGLIITMHEPQPSGMGAHIVPSTWSPKPPQPIQPQMCVLIAQSTQQSLKALNGQAGSKTMVAQLTQLEKPESGMAASLQINASCTETEGIPAVKAHLNRGETLGDYDGHMGSATPHR